MLQITSGKFFDPAKGVHRTPSEVILYSNLAIVVPMDLGIGTLKMLANDGPYFQYSFQYDHLMEKREGGFQMVKADEKPLREQLGSLLTVFAKAYFSSRLESVETICSAAESSKLVSSYLEKNRSIEMPQHEACKELIKKVIALSRADFEAIVACCKAIRDSLEALHTNSDLAYSLLVFAAESLAQRLDDYTPRWEDHPKRENLDPILTEIPEEKARAIKEKLVTEANFKSMHRFITFLESHLEPSYFLEEAAALPIALRKSEVKAALTKIYNLRSKYAHELQEIQSHLTIPQIAGYDVFTWLNEPILTFNGILRLLTHVLINFVNKRPALERENIDWRFQLPSVVTMMLSPELYIFRTDNIAVTNARGRLEGFLSLLTHLWSTGQMKIQDFTPVLNQLCDQYSEANDTDKRAIYLLAQLWTGIFTSHPLSISSQKLLEDKKQIAAVCTQETMIMASLTGEFPWSAEEMSKVYLGYEKKRVIKEKPRYPQELDVLVMLNIASRYKNEGKADGYKLWLDKARLDVPGNPRLQQSIKETMEGAERQNLFELVFPPIPQPEPAPQAGA